ncbi:indolepyruvate oxidoreductase subunit beta family protein [Hydrogenophaga sp. OTU3427]|uniref:indolepyruvate oxidoreductase subunit beta family protein n=1 Tax=Hydrogenophaga sp. OTU3427 TaxID=3043856 RepID=UPI00313E212C
MNTKTEAPKIVTVLVAAMGGEGGGVLADWLISASEALDYPVQSTSVPGVAQRTGATNYYLEILPVPRSQLGGREPIFSLTPSQGDVDIVAASELVEAGRVLQGGFVHPQRTTLVASTHREYSVSEKSAMGDGRYDGSRVVKAANELSQSCHLFDMRALAWKHGTVINTVMFGAMAGSGVLPFSREVCEKAIRDSGKAVESSLKGFAAGFEYVTTAPTPQKDSPSKEVTARAYVARVSALPEPMRVTVQHGVDLTTDYLDKAYADTYLDRVESIVELERSGGGDYPVSTEVARYLALWMAYEDVIRVADLKTRADRLERVRKEVGAKAGEPIQLTEFLKPGLDEICSVLPTGLANRVKKSLEHKAHKLSFGLHVRTDTVWGFTTLCALRALRNWRRRTSRFEAEQSQIEQWLEAVRVAIRKSPQLAYELALCGNLVKGYGGTSERGHRSLKTVLTDFHGMLDFNKRGSFSLDEAIRRVRTAREAALLDPEGRALARSLGLPPPPLKEQPIRFIRRTKQTEMRT